MGWLLHHLMQFCMQMQAGAEQEGNKRGSKRLPGVASRRCCCRGE